MNLTKLVHLFLLAFYVSGNAQTQLELNKFWSTDIVFRHTDEINLQELGHLKCLNQKNIRYCGKDTILNVTFYHYSNPRVTYVKLADTFQLHFVDFVQSKISLMYADFVFNKRTTVEDVLSYFLLNQTFVDTTVAHRTILSCSSHKRIYHICLLSNNSMPFDTIDLFFDKKKRLIAMSLPINCRRY